MIATAGRQPDRSIRTFDCDDTAISAADPPGASGHRDTTPKLRSLGTFRIVPLRRIDSFVPTVDDRPIVLSGVILIGSLISNRAPVPASDRTEISPPWRSMII